MLVSFIITIFYIYQIKHNLPHNIGQSWVRLFEKNVTQSELNTRSIRWNAIESHQVTVVFQITFVFNDQEEEEDEDDDDDHCDYKVCDGRTPTSMWKQLKMVDN